jgi:low affinity Fe/Cu permease
VSNWTSDAVGRPAAALLAVSVVLVWAATGPIFGFSDTWQLVINTGTTIVTFLMVFLIQNTQNRDAKAIHVKLDELIRATEGAHNALVSAEDMDDETLGKYFERFSAFAREARRRNLYGIADTAAVALEERVKDIEENVEEVEKDIA